MANGQDYWQQIFGRPPGESLLGPETSPALGSTLQDPLKLGPEDPQGPIPSSMPWGNIFGRDPGQELEPVKEPDTFLQKAKKVLGQVGGFIKKEAPAFVAQDPGLRGAVFAGVPKPEPPPRQETIGPATPEQTKFFEKYGAQWEMETRPKSYSRVAQEAWSRDPNVNYWSEKLAGKATQVAIVAGNPASAGYMVLYELFQQMKNIGFAVAQKTKYDPLDNRRLSEVTPEILELGRQAMASQPTHAGVMASVIPEIKEAPWWVRFIADLGEMGTDVAAAAIAGKGLSYGSFKFGFNKWMKGMKKAGVGKETLDNIQAKFDLIGKDLAAYSGLNRNIKNVFAKFRVEPTHLPPGESVPSPYVPTAAEQAAGVAAGRVSPDVPFGLKPGQRIPPVTPTPPIPNIKGRMLYERPPFISTPKPEIIPPYTDPATAAMATVRSGIIPSMDQPEIAGLLTEAPKFPSTVRTTMPLGTPENIQALERVRQYIPQSGVLPELTPEQREEIYGPEPTPAAAPQSIINLKPMPDGSYDVTTKPAAPTPIPPDDRLFQAQAADLAERLEAGASPYELADEAHLLGIPVSFLPEGITEEGMAKRQEDLFRLSALDTEKEIKAMKRKRASKDRTYAKYEVEGVGVMDLPIRVVSGRRWPKPVPYEWFRVLEYTNKGIAPMFKKGRPDEEYRLGLDNRLKSKDGEAVDTVASALGYEYVDDLYKALELGVKQPSEPTYSEKDIPPVYTEEDILGQEADQDLDKQQDMEREIARGISEMEELAAMPEIEKRLDVGAREMVQTQIPAQLPDVDIEEMLIDAARLAEGNAAGGTIRRYEIDKAIELQKDDVEIEDNPYAFVLKQDTAVPSMEETPFRRLLYYGHKWFNDIQAAQRAGYKDPETHEVEDPVASVTRAVGSAKQVEEDFGVDLFEELGQVRNRDDLTRGLRSIWRRVEAKISPTLPGVAPAKVPLTKKKKWAATTTPVRKVAPKFGKPAPKQLGLPEKEPGQLEIPAAAKTKEPWEMLQKEYVDGHIKSPGMHRESVRLAIKGGKPVPPKVLAEYPDLTPKPTVKKSKLDSMMTTKIKRTPSAVVKKTSIDVPKGRVRLVKVSVKTPLDDIEKLGEIPEDRIQNIKDYAKKLGIEAKLTVGDPFIGKYGEILSPAQQEKFMKEVIRDVKTKPKEVWKKWTELPDDPTELYSGFPILNELKKYGPALSKWIQIEPQFKSFGADRTGLALKGLHPRMNAVIEQTINQIKKIMKQYPELSDSDWQNLLFIAAAPRRHFGQMTQAERTKFIEPMRSIRKFFDNWGNELQRKGIIDDLWPASAVRYMNSEIANYEATLKQPGLSNDRGKKIRDKIAELNSAKEFLKKSGIQYVHIPRLWMQAWWDSDPAQGVKTISEFFKQRKSLDLETFAKMLIEDEKIKPQDLDIRRIMAAYGHQVGQKLAVAEIFRAAKTDKMIVPADAAPPTFQSFDTKRYPSLKGFKGHPALMEYMERNLFKQGFMHPKLGAFMGSVKVLQFYNPFFLPMYDSIQYFWLGILSPWKTPGAIRSATLSMKNKDQHYWNMHYWVGFSTPFTPGWKQLDKQIKDLINKDHFWQRFKKMNPYHWSWNIAWWGDNWIRMMTYHHQLSEGATPMEAAQIAAKLHGDYASIPPSTRKVLNKILFTPSFRISMLSAQAEMTKNLVKMLYKGKRGASGDTGALPPGDLFTEPIDGSIPEGPGKSAKYQRAMGKAIIGLVGGMLMREWFMTKVLGYKKDRFGLRYVKNVTIDGEEKELVQYMSSPDNVLMRYWHRFRTLANEPDKVKGFIDRAKWDFHPFLQLVYEVIQNTDPAGEPIYRPGLESSAKIGTDILEYSIKRIFRMLELVDQESPGKRKDAIDAMYKDMGKLAHFFRWFTLPYLRNNAEKRMMWRMNFTAKEFQRLMRDKPFETQEGADQAVERIQEFMQKMLDDIETEKKK